MDGIRNLAVITLFAGSVVAAQAGEPLVNYLREEAVTLAKRQDTTSSFSISIPESEATVIMSLFPGESGTALSTVSSLSVPESEGTIIVTLPTAPLETSSSASSSDLTLTHESVRTEPTASATSTTGPASTTAAASGNGVAPSLDTDLLRLGLPAILFIGALWAL